MGNSIYRWIVWQLTRLFILAYLKPLYRFRLTAGSARFPKPPFIVVANHGTFFDPWFAGFYSNHPFGFMVNDDGFRGKGISQWYLRSIGGFPKKKGAADFKAMKTTLHLLSRNYPVCIFPEGQTSWDGETQLIYKGIEKLIKHARCDLVTIRFQGNFLTRPWWARSTRKGRILVTMKVVDKGTIARFSDEQVFDLLRSSIYQNEIKDPENMAARFTGARYAEGLERFVWVCPECEKEDLLSTAGDFIRCGACGKEWRLDAHCGIKPSIDKHNIRDLKDFADFHKQFVRRKIASETDAAAILTASEGVILQGENADHLFENRAAGSLSLTKKEIVFHGRSGRLAWPIATIENCVIQKKDLFEFGADREHFRFLFCKKSPMKWVYYLRYLKGFEECERKGWQ